MNRHQDAEKLFISDSIHFTNSLRVFRFFRFSERFMFFLFIFSPFLLVSLSFLFIIQRFFSVQGIYCI